jgi:hypothetical protein
MSSFCRTGVVLSGWLYQRVELGCFVHEQVAQNAPLLVLVIEQLLGRGGRARQRKGIGDGPESRFRHAYGLQVLFAGWPRGRCGFIEVAEPLGHGGRRLRVEG